MFSRKGAVARLAAKIKNSFLAGFEKIQIRSMVRAREDLYRAVAAKIAEHKTPGAFGSAQTPTRYRPRATARNGAGLWRRNAAHGKVRGY